MKKLILLLLFIPIVSFGQDVMVIRVIDGDTFEIENGDKVRVMVIFPPQSQQLFYQLLMNGGGI